MLVVRTTENPAYPICELVSAEQPLGLYDFALAVNPLGLYRIEPRALGGQKAGNYAPPLHGRSSLTWRLWAVIQPLTSRLLCQDALSQIRSRAFLPSPKLVAAPTEKLRGYGAHRPTIHKSKPSLFKLRQIKPVAGERAFVASGIVLSWLLLEEAHRLARLAPGTQRRPLEATEPSLVLEAESPLRMGSRRAGSPDLDPLFSLILRIRSSLSSVSPSPSAPQASPASPGWSPR